MTASFSNPQLRRLVLASFKLATKTFVSILHSSSAVSPFANELAVAVNGTLRPPVARQANSGSNEALCILNRAGAKMEIGEPALAVDK